VTQLSRRDRINPVRLALGPWLEEFTRQYCETVGLAPEAIVNMGAKGIEMCFDPDQLFQVVSNLCQNALRASPAFGGTPLIKFQAGLDPAGRPYLDTIDWGKGVPPEIVDNIFDPFFTTTPKGTGLGLYIARELAEGNGGSLDYHPGDGGVGSRFRITFARAEECSEPIPTS
jgi:two-component system sensor histidine kinase PilS (NtrC family)